MAGVSGKITANVAGGKPGMVSYVVGGSRQSLPAVSEEEETIPTGSAVRIRRVVNNTAYVVRVEDSEESLRILLLEDDSCMAALLSQGLRAGFALLNIVTARTIAEAQVLIAEFRFDLFIMDIVLPDGSGIDFLCDLLTTQSDVTTVLMTSSPTLELRRKAADLGVRHFLTKPFKPETLFNIIWHTLASEQRSEQAGETFFSGALTRLTVLDIIQLKCLNGATQAIEFVGDQEHGRIYIDRDEWLMTPQTVNAVNLPAMNAMNFPAAILQPPFFDRARPAAMDYGAIGATIGHEISHSFDDQGALFDESGRLSNWWTPADSAHFTAAGERLAAQYSAYRPFPDLALNGRQVLSENIADVAGLATAFDAFERSGERAAAPVVAGFTPEQQFLLSYAQSWLEKVREPALRQSILTDSHAPAAYRTLTVRNLDAWYTAFGVKPGQRLHLSPEERARIW